MAKRQQLDCGPSLFDVLDIEEAKADVANCKHPVERATETVWTGEKIIRCTWTCESCNYIRGRWPQTGVTIRRN